MAVPWPRDKTPQQALTALAVAAAAGYAVMLALHLPAMLKGYYRNSDVSIAPVLAHVLEVGEAHGSIVIGNHPWYEELLGLTLVGWLPEGRALTLGLPLLWDLVGLALLFLAARRAFGRRAALLSVITIGCIGPAGRLFTLPWDFHGLPMFHCVLLAAALTYASRYERPLRELKVVLGAVLLSLASALPFASDQLFIAWGLVPLIGACLGLLWYQRGVKALQLLGLACLCGGVAVGGGELLGSLMRSDGLVQNPQPYALTTFGQLGHNAWELLQGLATIGGGGFFGNASDGTGGLAIIRGVLVLAALAAALIYVVMLTRRVLARRPDVAHAELVYGGFWALVLVAGLLAYLGTTASAIGGASDRYLLGPYIAIGALVAAAVARWVTRRGLAITTIAVALFALCGAIEVPRATPGGPGLAPGRQAAYDLAQYAAAEHVSFGYASYWAAASLTWEMHFGLTLAPVLPCSPKATLICRDAVGTVAAWYRPRPGIRSILVVPPKVIWSNGRRPDRTFLAGDIPSLGTPVASRIVDGMHVFVYDYDIASRFGPGPA